jgi:phenylacetate-CoA ligase
VPGSHAEPLDRPALTRLQGERLAALLDALLPANRFYAAKFAAAGLTAADVRAPADLARLPFTTKEEVVADQAAHPPYGTRLTFPPERYVRLHQTSGTSSGRPLRCLDTPESWSALLAVWATSFRMFGLRPGDRLFFPFSFGPFLGFWAPFEAGARYGCLVLPGGGMTSTARLRFLLDTDATAVFATPTYALHLAEVAAADGIDLARSSVRLVVVAGEPGGNVPATRRWIEAAWGARVVDHYGLTEVGPVAFECSEVTGSLHLLETDYLAEVVDPASGRPAPPGRPGELVLTTLSRLGHPLVRYRTGDLVRPSAEPCPCGRPFARLDGGVLGRADDMIQVRGNNLYPTALEALLRRFPDLAEYRVEVDHTNPLAELRITVEAVAADGGEPLARRVQQALRDELLFRAEVVAVPPGSLPRFEMKAKRVIHHRGTEGTEKTKRMK